MFGMSFFEIFVIAVVAVLVLGPDKLPQAMINIAKFFKLIKKSVNDAKSSFDQEMKISELKEDAKKYKENMTKTTENVRKKLTFEELDELKKNISEVSDSINKGVQSIKDPKSAIKNAVLGDDESKEA
ncbi:MAG: Sec-independent protein translocase protein TatB [Campylobacter sp.]|nr:Sec-independent protein translocase protein TatB [Campylobacter sp.]